MGPQHLLPHYQLADLLNFLPREYVYRCENDHLLNGVESTGHKTITLSDKTDLFAVRLTMTIKDCRQKLLEGGPVISLIPTASLGSKWLLEHLKCPDTRLLCPSVGLYLMNEKGESGNQTSPHMWVARNVPCLVTRGFMEMIPYGGNQVVLPKRAVERCTPPAEPAVSSVEPEEKRKARTELSREHKKSRESSPRRSGSPDPMIGSPSSGENGFKMYPVSIYRLGPDSLKQRSDIEARIGNNLKRSRGYGDTLLITIKDSMTQKELLDRYDLQGEVFAATQDDLKQLDEYIENISLANAEQQKALKHELAVKSAEKAALLGSYAQLEEKFASATHESARIKGHMEEQEAEIYALRQENLIIRQQVSELASKRESETRDLKKFGSIDAEDTEQVNC
jgi:hypothetical protein